MNRPEPVNLREAFGRLEFLADRTPTTPDAESARAFASLATCRDGAVFIGHYAGNSQWERHPQGDEVVMVVDGETTLILLEDGRERAMRLCTDEMLVVPRNTWHRFETPSDVKILTVTPQPTDHSLTRPVDG